MDEIESLISKFPELEVVSGTRRVRCKLSGHEMPYTTNAIQNYTGGKKFLKLKKDADFPYETYKPFITPSEEKKNALFCCLTGKYINKLPHHVEKHTKGNKYQLAKLMYDAGKKELIRENAKGKPSRDEPEKDPEESGGKEEKEEEEDMMMGEKDKCEKQAVIDEKPLPSKERKRKLNAEVKDTMSKKIKMLKKRKVSVTRGKKMRPAVRTK